MPASWAIEPVVGAVFLLFWIVAEVGRGSTGIGMMVAFAVAIGLARVVPIASLVILPATVLLQVVGVLAHPESTDWPVYSRHRDHGRARDRARATPSRRSGRS